MRALIYDPITIKGQYVTRIWKKISVFYENRFFLLKDSFENRLLVFRLAMDSCDGNRKTNSR